jgi:2-oxoglutarate ferredoxin oxidoreductase subunit alpha
MATVEASPLSTATLVDSQDVVNDFSIEVATVNGSGSQSANLILLRALFQMGIPVSGKNLFPSNIAGLPTWYTIRTNKRGFIGRKKEIDFLVAMNPETAREDVINLHSGAAAVYDAPLKLNELRSDVHFYPVPFDELVAPVCPVPKLRKLVRNIIYDGVLAFLLDIEMDEIKHALFRQFANKLKAAEMNWAAAQAGYDWAKENLSKLDPCRVERMNKNQGKIIIEGNTAAALGCVFNGVSVVTWYPITPSSSLAESIQEYASRFRIDPDSGKATFAVVQAEDELASIGMAIGAGWAGARSMTTTAGPGISLMSEFVGLGYFAEIPVVIFDVQRMGPSTGLPTRTSQGDLLSAATLSHGDTRHFLLIPSNPEECFEMAGEAFDLAEELQTPVFVMLDLDLGMNYWMSDQFKYPTAPIKRGKVLSKDDLDRLGGFSRYEDVDGDGIPYRTLPGTDHAKAAYFTRGSGHNEQAGYSEREADWQRNIDRLARKFETGRKLMPPPDIDIAAGAKIGLIGCGTTRFALDECRDQLAREYELPVSLMRVKAYPFNQDLAAFVDAHDHVYVVDQNRDGQLLQLIRLDQPQIGPEKLRSVRYYGGMPLDARTVTDAVIKQEGR